jgi:hypothetical protein
MLRLGFERFEGFIVNGCRGGGGGGEGRPGTGGRLTMRQDGETAVAPLRLRVAGGVGGEEEESYQEGT